MHTLLRLLLLFLISFALPAAAYAQVDINHADAKALAESLSGVGLVKAEAIVAYRNANGPFRRIDDLAKVKGIGAKTIDANRDAIVIVSKDQDAASAHEGRPAAAAH